MLNKIIVLFVISVLLMTGYLRAEPVSDESLFIDNFSGSAIDLTKWNVYHHNSVEPAVGDGLLTIDTIPDGISAVSMKPDVLDFSKLPSQWVAAMRFVVNDIETLKPDRQVMLLMPCSGWMSYPDTWEAIAFDLRLRRVNGKIWLTWRGYDGTDAGRDGTCLATLDKGKYYTVTVQVRNSDQKVDVYLDNKLITTRNLLVGADAGNVDQRYPDTIVVGTATDPNINMSIDFIRVGVNKK